jgi:DNA-directed RNA polymerase specialized sigma24 family protein
MRRVELVDSIQPWETAKLNQPGSITIWLNRLKDGSRDESLNRLWERYFGKMVAQARDYLKARPRPVADAEDVAILAFESFVRRAQAGLFPKLEDRADLWKVLGMLTARKAVNQIEWDAAEKRGGGNVLHISAVTGNNPGVELELYAQDPDPKDAIMLAEGLEEMLSLLGKADLREVALWRMEGYTNQQIATKLGRSVATVERKLKTIRTIYQDAGIWGESSEVPAPHGE